LSIQNDKTIAIGNMNVNAGGDELGPGGKIVKTSSQRVREQAALHTMVPDDLPIQTGSDSLAQDNAIKEAAVTKAEQDAEDRAAAERILAEAEIEAAKQPKRQQKPEGGLAAAVAAETKVEHKAIDPKPAAKKKKGVKRI
ncbi:MAG: hypothetical protein DRQ62_10535, partial [Gammaproteobacteria bacterium]